MKHILFLLLLVASLYSSSLLTHNIYEREDRVDVMLSFDAPYEGQILQKKGTNVISLTLLDVAYDELIEKSINSSIIQELSIEPTEHGVLVSLGSKNPIAVYASKTIDGFGLRIRSKLMAPVIEEASVAPLSTQQATTSKSQEELSLVDERYIAVIGVMIVLLLFLFWLKRKVQQGLKIKPRQNRSSWLFKNETQSSGDFKIISQKSLDAQNKVVLISFQGNQYLAITGSTNLLLDKFGTHGVKSDDEFQAIFEQNRQKLDNYLKLQQNSQLNSYKQKASQEYSIS